MKYLKSISHLRHKLFLLCQTDDQNTDKSYSTPENEFFLSCRSREHGEWTYNQMTPTQHCETPFVMAYARHSSRSVRPGYWFRIDSACFIINYPNSVHESSTQYLILLWLRPFFTPNLYFVFGRWQNDWIHELRENFPRTAKIFKFPEGKLLLVMFREVML
jgi:hypothetical protein